MNLEKPCKKDIAVTIQSNTAKEPQFSHLNHVNSLIIMFTELMIQNIDLLDPIIINCVLILFERDHYVCKKI